MRNRGAVARRVELPGAYGAAPHGTRALAGAGRQLPHAAGPVVTRSW